MVNYCSGTWLYRYRIISEKVSMDDRQCCVSELIFFGYGFTNLFSNSDSDTLRIRIQKQYFDQKFFFKWCLRLLSYRYVSEELVRQRKKVSNRKRTVFLFPMFHLRFFTHKISFYDSVWIRIRIRTFFSDSDAAKT
jgi:hypothetical protein